MGQLRNPRVSGALTTQKSAETYTQLSEGGGCCAYLLLDGRHGVLDKGVEGFWVGVSLHVWSHYLGVLPVVTLEGVTLPSPFCLDHLEGDAAQQVFKSGTDADAVAGDLPPFVRTSDPSPTHSASSPPQHSSRLHDRAIDAVPDQFPISSLSLHGSLSAPPH